MTAFRRVMTYLGLVDDDEYDEYEGYDDGQQTGPARPYRAAAPEADPVASGIRTLPREGISLEPSGVTVAPRSSVVRPIMPVQSSKPHTVAPASFNDCQEIGDRLKAGVPVIVNLQAVERDLMRRIVDFMSGLSYGIGADMDKTADRVYLLTPTSGASRS